MNSRHDIPGRPPASLASDWLEAIERGEADLAAGRVVPASQTLAALGTDNERLVARLAKKAPDAA